MDEPGRQKDSQDDNGEFGPAWPQRPDRKAQDAARPRLDPPLDKNRGNIPAQQGEQASPAPWTSHPTSHNVNGYPVDDPDATRVLPVENNRSRFDNGRQAATPPPAQPPAQPRPQPQPQPQRTPYDQQGGQATGQAANTGQATPRPRPQPESRPSNGWQYERDEPYFGGDGYGDQTRAYRPEDRAARQVPPVQAYPRGKIDASKSYLSVEVEGASPRRGGWVLWMLGGIIAIALIVSIAVSLAWQGQYAGKLYAGVSVLGTDLGGKTPAEAKKLLRDKVQAFMTEPVILTWRGKEWRPSLDDMGVQMNIDATVDEAFAVGRGADFFGNLSQQWGSAQGGYKVPLTIQMSEPVLQEYLNNIASGEINQELFEGDVRLNGSQVEALPGKEGRTLDTFSTIQQIRQSVASLEPAKKIELPVQVVQPTVSASEVQDVQSLLAIRVSAPITATTLNKTFTLDREAIVRFTTIERNPDRTAQRHVQLGWNDRELKTLAEAWVKEANRPAQNARFTWNGGQLAVRSESVDGFETDADTIVNAIKQNADTTDKRQFELPGKVITPTVSSKDLPSLGIKELMGSGTSTFKGSSQERATNITVAANLLDGAVVPPGQTFSFLQQMGGIDESHGFVQGYVIAAERTQLGVGGGVCQVSTTMFRAAFWSGMGITERNPHSYRVSWYEANGEPVGFDAAVFDPGVDLKFVNTTGSYVLIEAGVADSVLTVNIYGTKIPGEIKLEGPVISNRTPPPPDVYEVDTRLPAGSKKQVETARAGLETNIVRRIVVPGQPDKVDEFHSTYQAWPNWYIVASPSQIPGGAQPAPKVTPNP